MVYNKKKHNFQFVEYAPQYYPKFIEDEDEDEYEDARENQNYPEDEFEDSKEYLEYDQEYLEKNLLSTSEWLEDIVDSTLYNGVYSYVEKQKKVFDECLYTSRVHDLRDLSLKGNEIATIFLRNLADKTNDDYERKFLLEKKIYKAFTNKTLRTHLKKWISGTEDGDPIKYWDVRKVTDMSELFYLLELKQVFNRNVVDLTYWDVSNVTNMNRMFYNYYDFVNPNPERFNCVVTGIKNWNTCRVQDMTRMFQSVTNFNEDIGTWDTRNVTNMSYMFAKAITFNQNIGAWDTRKVKDMSYMFYNATSFNSYIGGWKTNNVMDMNHMFFNAISFDKDIGLWDTSNVIDMNNMFSIAIKFNRAITEWNTSNVIDMNNMFSMAEKFNQYIGDWKTTSVINMKDMFYSATAFDQNIEKWDTSNVVNMSYMFYNATSFNQPLNRWNTSKVEDMNHMFYNAIAFNQPIHRWDTSRVTNMSDMFSFYQENENIFKTLLNTYNTNVLDVLDIDLQKALQREAEFSEKNPNPSGKKREILLKLINNHYDPDKIKPSAKFIGGPKNLTVHYLPEYQKKIYIFGERHSDIMDCQKFPNFRDKDVIIPVEDYFYKLITNTDVFIDIFAEFNTYDKSGEYPKDYEPYENMNGRIAKLFTNFTKCLQKNTRHDEDCKLARIHYIDIRSESGKKKIKKRSLFFYYDIIKSIIYYHNIHMWILKRLENSKFDLSHNDRRFGYIYYFVYKKYLDNKKKLTDDEIIEIWSNMTIKHKNKWAEKKFDRYTLADRFRKEINTSYMKKILSEIITKDDNEYKTYWKKIITDNKFIQKENKRHIENPALKDAILTFINTEIDGILMKDKQTMQEYIQYILKNQSSEVYDFEGRPIQRSIRNDNDFVEIVKETIQLLENPNTILTDYYALLRVFTNFDMTDMEKAYIGATDQPSTANNIIIYAGDYHSDRYRRFLKSIGNVPIEKTGQLETYGMDRDLNFLSDTTIPKNCIDMTYIRQPFFIN